MTGFRAPANTGKYHYEGEGSEPKESLGDRYGEFVPELVAQADAADAQPKHEDLLARQPRPELTEGEKRVGRLRIANTKALLGFDK